MVELEEYEALRRRPEGRATMFQSWRDLTFLHIGCDPEIVQSKLPEGLTVDTFDGKAWVGLVPFHMRAIRPIWGPAAPWLSAFPETNVRTYVHREGKEPGVWFFSLDAARWLACSYARVQFGLPYFHARMTVELGEKIRYRSERPSVTTDISVVPGEALPSVEPGTFEYFLVERYLLYARYRGALYTGRVFHPPYPLRQVELLSCKESLLAAHGFVHQGWDHLGFSSGVDVEVFSVRRV